MDKIGERQLLNGIIKQVRKIQDMQKYKWHNLEKGPSDFAKSLNYKYKSILDLGCGNGRDSIYFIINDNSVCGIDLEAPDTSSDFRKESIEEYLVGEAIDCTGMWDVIYCRFLFHIISEKLEDKILKYASQFARELAIEVRAKGDKPIIYTDHKRRFADPSKLIKKVVDAGFKNVDAKIGYGLAKYKNEDPYILRIIAKK
jgi:SAM-dependent methyltransferase